MRESLEFNDVYFRMTLSGHVDHVLNSAQKFREQIFVHPGYPESYLALWDLRNLSDTSGGLTVNDMGEQIRNDKVLPKKVAFVVGSQLVYGLVRQLLALQDYEKGNAEYLLTYDFKEADRFLRET